MPWLPVPSDLGYHEKEPSAGKPHARICEGESRIAELLDHLASKIPTLTIMASNLSIVDQQLCYKHYCPWCFSQPFLK